MYIGIAGNIGSGKGAMIDLLAEAFGWNAHKEHVEGNPSLAKFYTDMPRWAFNLQVFFLTHRFKAVQRAMWSPETEIIDRTLYEDANVFVENLLAMELMDRADYDTYMNLYRTVTAFVAPPDILIYLKASVPTLMSRIRQNGSPYEMGVSYEYLTMLNRQYEKWIDSYRHNLVTVDVDELDFEGRDRNRVIEIIKGQLTDNLRHG